MVKQMRLMLTLNKKLITKTNRKPKLSKNNTGGNENDE